MSTQRRRVALSIILSLSIWAVLGLLALTNTLLLFLGLIGIFVIIVFSCIIVYNTLSEIFEWNRR